MSSKSRTMLIVCLTATGWLVSGRVVNQASAVSCAANSPAVKYVVEARAVQVNQEGTAAVFKLIKTRRGPFKWKTFSATYSANLQQDLEATTTVPTNGTTKVSLVPLTFQAGASYSLSGDNVRVPSKFRGVSLRLDLNYCSPSRLLTPVPEATVAPVR